MKQSFALALSLALFAGSKRAEAQEPEPQTPPAPEAGLTGLSAEALRALEEPDPGDVEAIDDRPLGSCDNLDPQRLDELVSREPDRVPCFVGCNVQATCAALSCQPASADSRKGDVGYCGACTDARSCGGRACEAGRCSLWADPITPDPVYPLFYLLTLDATLNVLDAEPTRVLPGVGFVFQGAFSTVKPVALDSGGWLTTELPRWYFNLGGSVSLGLSGTGQILADAGLTRYLPWPALFLTSLSLGPVYQRRGDAAWKFGDTDSNVDRLGGGVTLGFLYNVFFRAAYLTRVRGEAPNSGSLIISLMYMHDLVDELVPDRFKKFIPKEFR